MAFRMLKICHFYFCNNEKEYIEFDAIINIYRIVSIRIYKYHKRHLKHA